MNGPIILSQLEAEAPAEAAPVAVARSGPATGAFVVFLAFVVSIYANLPKLIPALEPLHLGQTLIGLAALALAWAVVVDRRPLRFGLVAGGVPLFFFFCLLALSPLWSVDSEVSTAAATESAKYLAAFVIAANVIDSRRRLRVTMAVIALATLIPAIGAINSYLHGDVVEGRAVWLGIFHNSNYLAYHLVMAVPLCLALRDTVPAGAELRAGRRSFWLGVILVLAVAIFVTGSRGGTLGLAAVVALWMTRNLFRGRIALGALLAVGVAILMAPGGPWNRADTKETISGGIDRSAQGRIDAWRAGLNMVEANPTLGVGAGAFIEAYEQYARGDAMEARTAHNSYVMVAAELGLPALFLFGLALACAFLSLGRGAARRARLPGHGALERGLQTGLFGFIVCSVTASLAFTWPLYFFLGGAAALRLWETPPRE